MRRQGELENTEMLDLSQLTLSELLTFQHDDLADTVERVLKQVARPRFNLGGSGPPGRAD